MKERVVIKGNAMWASLFEPNSMSDKYQVDICNLDKNDCKAIEGLGISVRVGEGDKADKGSFITAKTKLVPKVVDSAKNPWPENMQIGNGSVIKCSISPYEWRYQKKAGISASLNSIMIVDYTPYVGNDEIDAEEDGFVLSSDNIAANTIDDFDGDDEL